MTEKPITQLLNEVRSGGEDAMNELLPLVYDELRRLAGSYLRRERGNHTLQPTALVHEAYIRLMTAQAAMEWQDRAHFFGISARLMRQVLIDHARTKGRLKRGGEHMAQIDLDAAVSFDARNQLDAIAIDEALTQLESLDERQARIVEMKFFAGMQIEEIAEVLQVSPATVKREWTSAKLFLSNALSTTG
ncbi:MAG: sigma-70 family RNA polymerase sigma factor [Pyrinomonadaceae bacterium]